MVRSRNPSTRAEWLKEEGGKEHPTHIETLQKPEQKARINWLRDACGGTTDILDLGCNWGYVLNELNGHTGMDINVENIDKAMREFPARHWIVGDLTKDLTRLDTNGFAIVILADVLEHIEWGLVRPVLLNAIRIARHKVLITLPRKKTEDCACCFKHAWIPDIVSVVRLIRYEENLQIIVEPNEYFFYMEVDKC